MQHLEVSGAVRPIYETVKKELHKDWGGVGGFPTRIRLLARTHDRS